MKSILLILLASSLLACGRPEPPGEQATAGETATAEETSTASGYVENVTRAQEKARAIAAEEQKRVDEVNAADQ